MLLPNTHSFLWTRGQAVEPDFSTATETLTSGKKIFLPNTHSFVWTRGQPEPLTAVLPETQPGTPPPTDSDETPVGDTDKRSFLKIAGVAGAGLVASQLLPSKASALVMGSSPTTGVVGVKNAANTRINPATEESLSDLLKTSDLTFDAGSLEVKITSLPTSLNSFSDSGDVAKSGLVDGDRHVQVDVLSSALPSSASTETTLQTISFGGYKFTLRLATVGDVDYVGEASIGTATSAASWRIKKVDNTTGTVIQWAGTGIFNQVWDNRASLSYS